MGEHRGLSTNASLSMQKSKYADTRTQLHEDATRTPEFAEEIQKLMPHFGPGTGAWYAALKRHQ